MAVETARAVRDPEYYLRESSLTEPVFALNGARILGIDGTWDERTFLNLYNGYTTGEDGERDKKLPRYMHPDRRGAFELTVNSPKDVSTLNLVGGDGRIDGVMRDTYLAVAKEVERQALVRSNKKTGCQYDHSNNLICNIFDHSSSRLGDPHRHGHLVFENLSLHGKSWKAIELGYLDYPKLTEITNRTMRQGLNKLGYKTVKDKNSFRVVGFPWDVKVVYSQRNAGIKELEAAFEAKKGKPLTGKAKGKLSLVSRPEKPDDRPLKERVKDWKSRISARQLTSIRSMVSKARHRKRRDGLRGKLSNYLSRARSFVLHEPERTQGRER